LWRNENRAAAPVALAVVTDAVVTAAPVGSVAPVVTTVGATVFMGRSAPSSHLQLRAFAEVLTASRPDAIGFLRSICELQRARRPCLWVRDSCLYPTIPASIRLAGPPPLLREMCQMHPAPAISAPCPPLPQSPSLAELIGEVVAAAVAVIAVGLDERGNGGLRPKTKLTGADLITQLFALRQACAGELDFDVTAREYGKRAVAARYTAAKRELPDAPQGELTDVMLDELVSWPLDILAGVVRATVN
jgi:hypothetical protein